jgi:hypothetical protein
VIRRTKPRPVFSVWAWLVLAPYLLVALGGMDGASLVHEWLLGISVSLAVHGILLLVFLAIGALEVAAADRPAMRWTLVAVALVGIAFGRPALVSGLQALVGVDLVPTPEGVRVVLNFLVIGLGCFLVYWLRQSLASTRDSRSRLLAVLDRLSTRTDRIEAMADEIAGEFQREVRGPVLDALGGLVARDLSERELSDELRWVAHAVVRPLSHRATEADLEDALEDLDVDTSGLTGAISTEKGSMQRTPIGPAAAWLVTAIIITVLLPAEVNANGVWPGLPLAAAGIAVSLLGGMLLTALPRPSRPRTAFLLLTLEELLLGALTTAAMLGPVWGHSNNWYYFAVGTLGYCVVAVALGVITSRVRELAVNQERTAAAVAEAEHRAFDARQRLAVEARATGRLLHTEVQGDLIATSLQLRLGTAGPAPLARLLERVDALLDDPVASDGDMSSSASAIRDGFQASLEAWSLSLDLEIDVEAEAIDRLAEQPRSAAIAHDAVTEGLTNAVRHGRGEQAAVTIRIDPGEPNGVEVTVANPGRIATANGRGIGLRELDARAREVSLKQVGGDVVLRVLV